MKSFLNYMGGKSLLVEKIVGRIPEHTCYCEAFAGAATGSPIVGQADKHQP